MTDEYEVGYGKPPNHTKFKKGQSGNPTGRPKKRKTLTTSEIFGNILDEETFITLDGVRKPITLREATCRRIITDTVNGKASATKLTMNMIKELDAKAEAEKAKQQKEDKSITVRFVD